MSPPPPINANDRVYQPDHPEHGFGIVRLVEENILDDQRTCQVAFDWMPGLTSVPESALRHATPVQSGTAVADDSWGSTEELQRRLGSALAMAENSRTGTFMRSFATPLPHQAFLLEKIVAHNRLGHLIADDVGMGKTIEAGLIIATLRQQNPRARILVLAPAGVVLQWQDEMEEHFGLAFSIAGRDFRADHLGSWSNNALTLVSLDTLKQERHRDTLKQVEPFDLVVCDEAHRLTARREFLSNDLYRTQSYKFVEWLSQERVVQWIEKGDGTPRSPRILMLTATPHQGDDLRFAYVLQLARPDLVQAEDAVAPDGALADVEILQDCITRTAKKHAVDWQGKPIFKGHESRTLDVDLCDQEKDLLEALTRYVLVEMQFETDGRGEQLVRALALHTYQKIAASSWTALEGALQNRLDGKFPSDDGFSGEDSMGQEFEFLGDQKEHEAIVSLLARIRKLPGNSKWEQFSELITPGNGFREEGERILIFTQFRRTQEWLAEQLTARGERVAQIHGGLSLDERRHQRAFFESEATVLISTEAGSEGANLHRKCHLEINYDLPWNPMRLLQRIGRLDRYGQKHVVRVVNLRAPRSWDSEISVKISTKLDQVQASMGLVADEDYRTMILGQVHDAINVPSVMAQSQWGKDTGRVESAVSETIQDVLTRKNVMDRLYRKSLGMPEGFNKSAPSLQPDEFRQAFTWVAAGQQVMLRETRTSDNRFLRGVYHFTLPEAFRGGLRASREVYLVFDRETFSEVRGEVLGKARGQEIKPSLAGFGDPVTDWFFRRGLHAGDHRTLFSLCRSEGSPAEEAWWITFAARWKQAAHWAGPDALFTVALGEDGTVIRAVSSQDAFTALQSARAGAAADAQLPPLESAQSACKGELRNAIPKDIDPSRLALFPLTVVHWTS